MSGKERVHDPAAVAAKLQGLPHWKAEGGWLERAYDTDGWPSTILVVGAIAFLAESSDHHPDLTVTWPRVVVRLQTHSAGGITDKDFDLARRIEETVTAGSGKKLVK